MDERKWSERFKLYAQSQGMSPEDVLARDDERWPGGKMAGFIMWSGRMLNEFGKTLPNPPRGVSKREQIVLTDPAIITEWIRKKVDAGVAQ